MTFRRGILVGIAASIAAGAVATLWFVNWVNGIERG